ncbi:hypothetical protein Glove_132g223 [Diversispora epigaea]|uniref:Uncharacterized protein n=1 Tax=Diversispora epigaea TaxID=1348612 RepID=A0A397J0B6_9GLOM|nr:hypothetical protein Glove_132g223 [Diversispora epigaea]
MLYLPVGIVASTYRKALFSIFGEKKLPYIWKASPQICKIYGTLSIRNKLGYCYLLGIGTTKDDEKTFQWYIKSAEGGNSSGRYSLVNCKDEKKALCCYLEFYIF